MTYTVRDICQRFGVTDATALSWINSGLLVAINVAGSGSTQPRWRITQEALSEFERLRASRPKPQQTSAIPNRRTRKADDADVVRRY